MKPEQRVFELTYPTKKISGNYYFNKFSEFKHILFEAWNVNLSPSWFLLHDWCVILFRLPSMT